MLELNSICKSYKSLPALQDISFHAEKGEIIAILGPNGSGKTTLYKILSGLIPMDQGFIVYKGSNIYPKELRSLVGYCPQSVIGWKNLTIKEQLVYQLSIQKNKTNLSTDSINGLLASLNLKEYANSTLEKLSGGTQKRFSIAMSLVRSPQILILDEPTNGLDLQSKRMIHNLLKEISSRKDTLILLSGHDLSEMERLASRHIFLKSGKLIKDQSADSLMDLTDTKVLTKLEKTYLDLYETDTSLGRDL